MLQDLSYGRLENEFRNPPPEKDDILVCFRENEVLLCRRDDDSLLLPSFEYASVWSESEDWSNWPGHGVRYVFHLHGKNYFLWMGTAGVTADPLFQYEPVRALRQLTSKDTCFAIMTAWHLYRWYSSNLFCGHCGTRTVHDDTERMMRCPSCGNMIFPRISPAVIVGVTNGDKLLLSKYAGRSYTRYALIAGFTEIGETIEQTVQREVMEEVGLKVKNIRYYKSQPWGVDGNVLMGFYCDLDGDDTITLDEKELSLAEWHHRSSLPAKDDGISLTREMIRIFEDGKEPK